MSDRPLPHLHKDLCPKMMGTLEHDVATELEKAGIATAFGWGHDASGD